MSAIFGCYMRDNMHCDADSTIMPMAVWNRPYGNSAEDIYAGFGVFLGCCVESISDSHVQNSPILKYAGYYAVIDAILYNRRELINEFGISEDEPDAQILLSIITGHGPESLKDVNGDFSGAIYSEKEQKLILFRDHMGIRPLYYYSDERCVAFSTDLRGLTACPQVNTKVSETWIYDTVFGYDADMIDNTPYERVKCVAPATYLSFDLKTGLVTCKKYWSLGRHKIRKNTDKEYILGMRELIEDSVKRRLDAVSGLVGAELSGGLDSGVIDILINRAGRECVYYSWSYDPSEVEFAENDERLIINDICKQENITCNFTHYSSQYESKMAEAMKKAGIPVAQDGSPDFRFAFLPSANTYAIINGAQFVKERGASVLFTGHGGDEGVSHRAIAYEMYYHHEYYHFLRHIWSLTRKKNRFFTAIKNVYRVISTSKKDAKEEYLNWFSSPELLQESFAIKMKKSKKRKGLDFSYDPVAYIESGGSRNRLDNMAIFGAYSGIRYMIPFLDYRVIDYAVSIPRYLFFKGNVRRYIYREAFKDIMPKSLYKVNIKEDTSVRNIKAKESDFSQYAKRRAEIIGNLNREYWSKYLNFEKIDELLDRGESEGEEFETEMRRIKALLKCALAQNVLQTTRPDTK